MPIGSTGNQFTNVDPTNQPAAVTNALVNFGWEYVWHCHILGHEENDMMRPMILAIAPSCSFWRGCHCPRRQQGCGVDLGGQL